LLKLFVIICLKKEEVFLTIFLQKIILTATEKYLSNRKTPFNYHMELQMKFFLCISFYENS